MTESTNQRIDLRFLSWLRIVGVVEGISTLILFFVAMPLKYLAGQDMAVSIAGSIHGALFVLLVIMLAIGRKRVPLSDVLTVGGVIAAVIPFGPFVVERYLGRLAASARDAA